MFINNAKAPLFDLTDEGGDVESKREFITRTLLKMTVKRRKRLGRFLRQACDDNPPERGVSDSLRDLINFCEYEQGN